MYLFIFSKHVVFGRVVQGKDVVDFIENQETDATNRPKCEVLIANCGEMVLVKKSAKQPKPKADESESEEDDDSSSSSSSEDERKKRKRKRKEKKKLKKKKKKSKKKKKRKEEEAR